ncbi:MAG TPA: ATP-grasp domain-containing protein, partial [Thermoanaerobaculia bacterium]|nr:ATP-grasp domain-containing protein [Thermoanaerobaculia bacterium]
GVTASRVTDLEVVDYVEAIDWTRPLEIVQRIVDLHASGYIDGVIANDEFGLLPAAIATSRLGIPGPSLRGVHNTRDKFHMRRALEQAGLNQVRYAVCRGLADAQAFLSTIHGPIIVKPVTGTGSEGVSRVETAEELAAAYKTATSAVGSMGILCEEFIDGPEVSLEGYCVDGRFVAVALTDKLTDEHFLETGHQQPTAHPQSVIDAAAAIAAQSLPLLGIDNAVTHTEFRVSATRGPVLIETHTRMGGDQIHVLTRLTTGVDLADLMVAFSIGETVDAHPAGQGRGAAIRFSTGRPGRVRAVQLPPRTAHSGIEAVFTPSIGRQFSGLSASRERQAYVIASAPTPELAGASAESFLSQVQVSYFE